MTILPKSPIIIIEAALRSRTVRIAATTDPRGIRRIGGQAGGILGGVGSILKKFAKFVGFVFGAITKLLPFSVSEIFGMLVQGYFLLKTFDWNQTDESIRQRINANNKAMTDALAPVIGTALGWGAVRLANFAIGKLGAKKGTQKTPGINIPVVSAKVGLALAEESREEIGAAWKSFVQATTRAQTENLILGFMLNARNVGLFGWQPITEQKPNGSFAAKIDEQIERLPEQWQNFVEEVIDSFEDAIIEAGYVIAFEIDDYFLAQKAAMQPSQTRERTVEVVFRNSGTD